MGRGEQPSARGGILSPSQAWVTAQSNPGLTRGRRAVRCGQLELGLSLSRPSTGLRHAVCAWSFFAPFLSQHFTSTGITRTRQAGTTRSMPCSRRPAGSHRPCPLPGRPCEEKLWSKKGLIAETHCGRITCVRRRACGKTFPAALPGRAVSLGKPSADGHISEGKA